MRINHRETIHEPIASVGGTWAGILQGGFRHPSQHHRQTLPAADLASRVWAALMFLWFCWWLLVTGFIDALAWLCNPLLGLAFAIPFGFCCYVVYNIVTYPIYIAWLRYRARKAQR